MQSVEEFVEAIISLLRDAREIDRISVHLRLLVEFYQIKLSTNSNTLWAPRDVFKDRSPQRNTTSRGRILCAIPKG